MLAFSERVVTLDVLRRREDREEKNDCGKREVPHFRFQEVMNFVDLNGAAGQRVSKKPTSKFIDPLYGRQ
jgi:hypothetical protein